MQPIDAADKRPPFKKIANSIRAAILTGEFEPGAQLPPGRQLAEFFGVSPMTVHQAVRTLRDEGFVTSRAGSGVFVSAQPAAPENGQREHPPPASATSCTRWASSSASHVLAGSSPASPTPSPLPSIRS